MTFSSHSFHRGTLFLLFFLLISLQALPVTQARRVVALTRSVSDLAATSIPDECAPSSCGRACAVKRGAKPIQTAVPYPEPAALGESPESNETVVLNGRNIPGAGSGNWGQWYDELKARPGTILIDNNNGDGESNTAIAAVTWGIQQQAIVVENLKGCIAVVCSSPVGKSSHAPNVPPRPCYVF